MKEYTDQIGEGKRDGSVRHCSPILPVLSLCLVIADNYVFCYIQQWIDKGWEILLGYIHL